MKKLKVTLEKKNYYIGIQKDILKKVEFIRYIEKLNEKIVIISDETVNKLYAEDMYRYFISKGIKAYIISIKGGENNKNYNTVLYIYRKLIELSIDRKSYLISLGGGITGDIVGFVAATYMRGIKFLQIPTTFLSQIDSSIGGKVGINLDQGKNLIGAFYHPEKVIIDTATLNTLDDKYFRDGISEAIKYGLIKNYELFEVFENNDSSDIKENIEDIIYTCIDIKREVVEKDEKESGDRKLLNFGHTIGHGIEGYYKYEKYTHGEGVAIGMYIISRIGEELGITKIGISKKIKNTLIRHNLPYSDSCSDINKLMEIISKDKKSHGETIDIVLPLEIGNSIIYPINKDEFKMHIKNILDKVKKDEENE